ncbi:MAG: ankyrin repeat domain-containing protein, partial [Pseudomonadota bacterium]
LFACKETSQNTTKLPEMDSEDHAQLVMDTKSAILSLDIALVDKLSADIDVNRLLPDNSTLLAWAAETQDPRLVSLMLERGAKTDVAGSNRFSPIIQACRYGNSEIINALLDSGADPNSAIEDGTNAFHLCSGSASTADLARMVSLGADVTAKNEYGQTAMMWAANAGNVKNILYLVENGSDINDQTNEGYSPLFFAIKSQHLDTVKALISNGADLFAKAQDGTTAAQLGVYTKNYEFLMWFVSELNTLMAPEAVEDVLTTFDRDGYQLLHAAVKANELELVTTLLKVGADPTTVSEPSTLKWRFEANFKTETYVPPQLTPIELAEQNEFTTIAAMLSQ